MANIYWVGGSGTWNTTSVTNWANASGGTGGTGTVPTTNDNIFFDQAGTYTVTMTGALNCSNITVSAGTVTFATGTSPTLGVSGSVSIIAGTAWNSTGTITFNATTAKTISTNGITIDAPVTFNGVAGSWQLLSAFTAGSTRTVTLTNGTLDLNNFTFTCGIFSSSGSTARTLAFGASGQLALTGSGNTIYTTSTSTNLTITGTVYINCLYTGGVGTRSILTGSITEAQAAGFNVATSGTSGVVLSPTATDTVALTGPFGNVNLTGFSGTLSNTTRTIYGNLIVPSSGGTYATGSTATTFASTSGTKTITTNGRTLDFPLTFNGVGGTWQLQGAVTINSTYTITLTNGTLDLNGYTLTTGQFFSTTTTARTIAFGTGNITVNGNSVICLDVGNATSLSITGTPIFQVTNAISSGIYLGTTPGYFTEANALSVYAGASTGAAGVYVSNTAALALNGNFKDVNFTGFTGSINNAARNIYGSLTLPASGTTFAAGGSATTFAATSGTKTITTNGVTLDFPVTFNGIGGTWQLQSALTIGSTRATTLTNGTIDLQTYTLTTGTFVSNGATTRSIAFGTGNITAAANSASNLDVSSGTNLTLTGTPIFQLTNATTNGAVVGTTAGYFTEANALSVFVGASTGAAGIYIANSSATLGGVFKDITLTGFTGTIANTARTIYGGMTIPGSGVTLTAGTATTTFAATSGTKSITSNGVTLDFPVTFNGVGGTWQLSGAFAVGITRTTTLTAGTLDLQSYTFTTGLFNASGSTARSIAFGTGNITVNGTGTVWTSATSTSLTTTGTQVVNVSNNTATATTVSAGTLNEANSISFNFTTGTYTLSFLNTAAYTAKNVNFTGFAGTWGATSTATIYGNLTIASGMTLTASTSAFTFGATSGIKTITSNSKTLDFPLTFNGVGGTWQIQGNLTLGSTRALTLTNGTIDFNNFIITAQSFSSSNSNARTLAFGTSGQFALSGNNATILDLTTATNLTTTGTVYINFTYTGATGTRIFSSGLSEAQSVNFPISTSGTSGIVLSPTATDMVGLTGSFGGLDLTGFTGTLTNATRTIYGNIAIPASGGTYTAGTLVTTLAGSSGTKTITTNGRTLDFPITVNASGATWQLSGAFAVGITRTTTLTAGTLDLQSYTFTTGLFSSSNSNTRIIAFGTGNITVNGTGTVWETTTTTNLTTTGTQVVNVSNNTATTTTVNSGALNEANAVSFNFTAGTYVLNFFKTVGLVTVPTAKNVDFTGFSGSMSSMQGGKMYGNLTLSSGMAISSGGELTFGKTSGVQSITANGKTIPFSIAVNGSGTTVQIESATVISSNLTLTSGTFKLNGYSLTVSNNFSADATNQTYLDITGSTFYIPSTFSGSANLNIVGSGTFSSPVAVGHFYGYGGDYSNVTLNLASAGGEMQIYSDNHFKDITNTVSPTTIYFDTGTTTTFDSFSLSGTAGNFVSINAITFSTPYPIVSKSSGVVACDYLSITRSRALGGAQWYAGSHSVSGGGNTGWIFSDPPVPSANTGNMFFIM